MKKLFTSIIVVCLLAATCLGVLAACGGSKEDIVIWAPQEYQSELPLRIEAFKEEYPEYAEMNIKPKVMGVDASIEALQKDPDAAADVFFFPSGGIT